MLAERNIDDSAFELTFDGKPHAKLTCFRIDEENACLVLGESGKDITAFIDPIPEDDDDD